MFPDCLLLYSRSFWFSLSHSLSFSLTWAACIDWAITDGGPKVGTSSCSSKSATSTAVLYPHCGSCCLCICNNFAFYYFRCHESHYKAASCHKLKLLVWAWRRAIVTPCKFLSQSLGFIHFFACSLYLRALTRSISCALSWAPERAREDEKVCVC